MATNDTDHVLRTENLERRFGNLVAVDDISISVGEENITAIIGPNGAGKSTFGNLLIGALEPTNGSIHFKGEDITDVPQHERCMMGMSKSYQITSIFPDLTVFENVRIAAQRQENSRLSLFRPHEAYDSEKQVADEILELVNLLDKKTEYAHTLPYGEKRALDIAISLATDPDLLLLDEPTAGLNESDLMQITALLRSISQDIPIVFIDHNMDVVMDLSDRICVLYNGSLLADGEPDDIRTDENVRRVYLEGS